MHSLTSCKKNIIDYHLRMTLLMRMSSLPVGEVLCCAGICWCVMNWSAPDRAREEQKSDFKNASVFAVGSSAYVAADDKRNGKAVT